MAFIYKIVNPKGKVYIGSCEDFSSRKSYYKTSSCKSQRKIHNSLQKYGFDSHKFFVIEEVYTENKIAREAFWQREYRCVEEGLNCKYEPLDGVGKRTLSEETKRKISESKKGKKRSQESIEKQRQTMLGGSHSEATKQKMKASRAKQRDHAKQLYQYNSEGELIRIWSCAAEAATTLGISLSYLRDGARGRYEKVGGFIWKYGKYKKL